MENSNNVVDNENSSYVQEFLENQNSASKKTVKKSKNSGAIILVILFMVSIIAAITFAVNIYKNGSGSSTITLPTVSTFCVSSVDNSSHSINAQFTITGDGSTMRRLGQQTLYEDVYSAISKIDFSQIPADNSLEYVKNYVQNYLSSKYKNIRIKEIYLTDFSTDEGTKINKEYNTKRNFVEQNDREGILNGISGWNK